MEGHQIFASVSVAIVVCVIGLPLWWNTTKVYRASLPYDRISGLSGSLTHIPVKVDLYIEKESLNVSEISLELINKHLDQSFGKYSGSFAYEVKVEGVHSFVHSELNLNIVEANRVDTDLLRRNISALRLKLGMGEIKSVDGEGLYFQIFVLGTTMHKDLKVTEDEALLEGACKIDYGFTGDIFFRCREMNAKSLVVVLQSCLQGLLPNFSKLIGKVIRPVTNMTQNSLQQRAVQYSQGLQISFVLINPDPENVIATWNIKEAFDCSFMPLLTQVEFLGPFDISSQILYFTEFSRKPVKGKTKFYYKESDLAELINSLESRIGSFTSNLPMLYFIVYVVPLHYTPLQVKLGRGRWSTSFISPKWGGVLLYNVNGTANSTPPVLHKINMNTVFNLFREQFKMLIHTNRQIRTIDKMNEAISTFDINLLMLERTIRNICVAKETLLSLSKLIGDIKNIVIGENIRDLVLRALESINNSQYFFSENNLKEAFKASREAIYCSEKAFFDPTLLALLYFPDDQKYAIYIPLFLPVGVPIVLSFIRSVKAVLIGI